MSEPKPIRAAATVVLARDSQRGMEVCMLKRSARSSFMASVMVYPGGALEASDFAMSQSERVHAERGLWQSAHAQAHALASLRETFEESGILATIHTALPAQDKVDQLRQELRAETRTFDSVLQELNVSLELDNLWFFDRWVTPPWESKRYDTWFFIVRAPEGQRARSDGQEVTAERWVTPADALQQFYDRELMLAPPTWATLRDLQEFHTVDDALRFAQAATPYPICPYFASTDLNAEGIILLPGDPEYPGIDDVTTDVRGTPRRTRIAMKDGLWRDYVDAP